MTIFDVPHAFKVSADVTLHVEDCILVNTAQFYGRHQYAYLHDGSAN